MKAFVSTFLSTLFAILVAAAIIWFVAAVYQAREHETARRERIRQITLENELSNAHTEWDEQMRRNPQFDPNGDKLTARLRQIREASETGKPIPPKQAAITITVQPQDGSGPIFAGTNVELLSQDGSNAHIRYSGREFIVPSSAVSESK